MNCKVLLNNLNGFRWEAHDNIYIKGSVCIDNEIYSSKQISKILSPLIKLNDMKSVIAFTSQLNGIFAIVIKNEQECIVITDLTRTFPIFYGCSNDVLYLSDCSNTILHKVSKKVDPLSKEEYLTFGYVSGGKTIYKNVKSVEANHLYVINAKGSVKHKLKTYNLSNKVFESKELEKSANTHLQEMTARLISSANGSPFVIPLSGGLDSRAIVALLYLHNYKNVICFTYGKKTSREYEISKFVSDKLGYKHHFIEYEDRCLNDLFSSKYLGLFRYCHNNVSLPHIGDIYAFNYLHNNKIIPKNAIIVPGHSGDLIGGSHIRSEYKDYIAKDKIYLDEAQLIYKKHVNQPSHYKYEILKRLQLQLKEISSVHYCSSEYWNIANRQAKYIVNSVRCYEYFDYEFRLPLWDTNLVKFFLELPIEYRLENILYEKVLKSLFKDLKIDIYINEEKPLLVKCFKPIVEKLPKKQVRKIKQIYGNYLRSSYDDNNDIGASKALGLVNTSHEHFRRKFGTWLIDELQQI